MDAAAAAAASESARIFNRSPFITSSNPSSLVVRNSLSGLSRRFVARKLQCESCQPHGTPVFSFNSNRRSPFCLLSVKTSSSKNDDYSVRDAVKAAEFWEVFLRRGLLITAAAAIGVVVTLNCRRAFAVEGVVSAGYGVWERIFLPLRSSWPKVLQVLTLFKEQGLVLAALLGLSAFFSMAETSITTLWPWKVGRNYT